MSSKKNNINTKNKYFMNLALKQAARSLGNTGTNPPVGSVITDKKGNLISFGRTGSKGKPHAEFDAIKNSQKKLINCNIENLKNSFQEIFKRITLPFYLPVLSLIASLIIIKSKDDYKFSKYKFILFIFGVIVILISEISIRYSSANILQNIYLTSLPILLFISIYFYLIKKFDFQVN